MTMTHLPTSARPAPRINLAGIGILALSLGIGVLVRLAMPDAIMHGPKAPLPEPGGYLATAYLAVFLAWLLLWFLSPRSPRLTLFGAAWSAIAVAVVGAVMWQHGALALLPGLAICVSFCALTFVSAWRMRRG